MAQGVDIYLASESERARARYPWHTSRVVVEQDAVEQGREVLGASDDHQVVADHGGRMTGTWERRMNASSCAPGTHTRRIRARSIDSEGDREPLAHSLTHSSENAATLRPRDAQG